MRLIDADEIRWTDHYDSDGNLSKYKIAYSDEMPPTVDAVPVRHAKLLNAYPYGECSICGYLIDIRDEFKYCPNCGARMEETKE